MKFLRTYIEISNICNLQCSFCPEVEREKKILSPEHFRKILTEVLPYSEQICLHLMGEPLAHPEFKEILSICEELGATIHLTTNGTYLKHFDHNLFYRSKAIRQINFSLHSFKDNYPGQDMRPYLYDILQFSKGALTEAPEMYINFRLWNLSSVTNPNDDNSDILDHVQEFFGVPVTEKIDTRHRRSKNITGRVYFHFDTRFEWPSYGNPLQGDHGFCHALTQQIGIHADGTVVPCCLDKEAGIPLGNVLTDSFANILNEPRLKNMRDGFAKNQLTEDLCKRCTYIKRFKSGEKRPPPQKMQRI